MIKPLHVLSKPYCPSHGMRGMWSKPENHEGKENYLSAKDFIVKPTAMECAKFRVAMCTKLRAH